jgi:2-polyprenyl-6-methoxyphenol hydroxylase-like FAD-dependent oxidoreductase
MATKAVVDSTWDVIVIGAGPAGAVTARELARSGRTTLLVDRQPFPRAKVCGGYLNGQAVSVLRSLGLGDALAEARPVPLRQFVLQASRQRAELELQSGVVVDRAEFDAALVRAAVRCGADFLPEHRATLAADADSHLGVREVQLCRGGGAPRTVRGRAIVAADGLGHPCLQRLPEFECCTDPLSRIGLGITFADDSPAYQIGVIYMAVSGEGYVGLVRTAPGQLNLAGALDPTAVKAWGDPAKAVSSVLEKAGLPRIASLPIDGWRGTPALTRCSARLASSRVFLVGDAAGYVEPFTGEGMAWAISSASTAAPYITQGLVGWDDRIARDWEVTQRRRMQHNQLACRVLALALRKPLITKIAVGVLARLPALARPFVRRISAQPNLRVRS